MYIKIHQSYRKVVALADKELVGKKFEEGKMQLDVRENFYKGEEFAEEQAINTLKQLRTDDATFNIVGEKAINAAMEAGIITKENTGKVQDIPFALVLL